MQHHELKEQVKLVRWLSQQQAYGRILKFTSIPNSTFTQSWSELNRIQAGGLHKGLLDTFILLSPLCAVGRMQVWIELKRPRRILRDGSLGKSPSTIQPEQIEWITLLNQFSGTKAVICYGADEAIRLLTNLIGDVSTPIETNEKTNQRIADFSSFISR